MSAIILGLESLGNRLSWRLDPSRSLWNCVDKMGGRIGEERTHLETVSCGQN